MDECECCPESDKAQAVMQVRQECCGLAWLCQRCMDWINGRLTCPLCGE